MILLVLITYQEVQLQVEYPGSRKSKIQISIEGRFAVMKRVW
jgi:hypothetical protein